MKQFSKKLVLGLCAAGMSFAAFAGNKDRSGQAGAPELLINPWGISTGLFGMNVGYVGGLDAMKTNVAGLSFVDRTDFGISHSIYMRSTRMSVNNIGIANNFGSSGVVGVNVQAINYGDIQITDYNNPMGGIGNFKPQFFNLQLAYAKSFSSRIHAGVAATYVTEQIRDARASGACFEAGIQYVTGNQDNFHFGLTLRNVGTNMRFSGSGFSLNSEAPESEIYQLSRNTPNEKFEMPTYLSIGASYDFFLDAHDIHADRNTLKHRLTVMGAFISNSFNNDQYGAGVEYAFRERFMARVAYRYEKDIFSDVNSTTLFTGLAAGFTAQAPIGSGGPRLAIDYSFRPTRRPSDGVHTISLRLMLNQRSVANGGSDTETEF